MALSSNQDFNKKKQSVENAGVAFVKGATEINSVFEKNKQTVTYEGQIRTNKVKD